MLSSGPPNSVQRGDHRRALVLDVLHARLPGDPARLVGVDVELQPQGPGADRGRLARDRGRVGGRPEYVDDVDLLGNLEQGSIDALAEERVGVRVHGNHAEASCLQSGRHRATGLAGIARRAYDRDGARLAEDLVRAPGHGVSKLGHAANIPSCRSRRQAAQRPQELRRRAMTIQAALAVIKSAATLWIQLSSAKPTTAKSGPDTA